MLKTKTKVMIGLAGLISVISAFSSYLVLPRTSATTCTSSPCNTTFEVDVKETLSVSVTTPTEWASGDIDTFLRNKITVNVVSNNPSGFVVGMNSGNTTSTLTNTAKSTVSLNTLSADWTRSSNVTNFWGYSTDDGNNNGTYHAVVNSNSTPTKIFDSDQGTSKDIYFGAKADITQASGTYAGTVVITAISGTKTISTPSDPATPDSEEEVAHHSSSTGGGGTDGTTTYTYTTTNSTAGTTTTTTQVSDGDNRDAYASYTPPQGVTENTESNIVGNSPLAASLAVTAAVAAAAGVGFYILAKRRERDEEEEEI